MIHEALIDGESGFYDAETHKVAFPPDDYRIIEHAERGIVGIADPRTGEPIELRWVPAVRGNVITVAPRHSDRTFTRPW